MFPSKGIPGGCGIGVVIVVVSAIKPTLVMEKGWRREWALRRLKGRKVGS